MLIATLIAAERPLGNISGLGKLGNPDDPFSLVEKLISNILGFLTVGAILWFVVMFVIGGYQYMTAGGDPKSAASARSYIMNATIGLVVVFAALVFLALLGYLLDIRVLQIGEFLKNLTF